MWPYLSASESENVGIWLWAQEAQLKNFALQLKGGTLIKKLDTAFQDENNCYCLNLKHVPTIFE